MNFENRIVWLKKQKYLTICLYECDDKCSVEYNNKLDIYFKSNIFPLSPQLPTWIIDKIYKLRIKK